MSAPAAMTLDLPAREPAALPLQTLVLHNGEAAPVAKIPRHSWEEFRRTVLELVRQGSHAISFFGTPLEGSSAVVRIYAAFGNTWNGTIHVFTTDVGETYPALTLDCPQLHWFEREIAEQWGVVPEGHPWLKPIRFHHSYRPGHDAWGRVVGADILPCVTNYFRVEGTEPHQVAVGPVHAGVIEPGHFRFQCNGEHVFHLEIELGYQHRGVERNMIGGPNKRSIHYMETLAGDTSTAHATAYCQILEGLAGASVPLRAQCLRAISMELERLANHTGDMGALSDDVAFLPTFNYCGRLRGDFLNATGLICGSRFGRGMVRPGGVNFDVTPEMVEDLCNKRLRPALRDVMGACDLLWNSSTVQARYENCGRVPRETAEALGLVGMAARACGIEMDVRHDFPSGMYRYAHVPVSTWHTGDVAARAYVRWLEIKRSGDFVLKQLEHLPPGEIKAKVGPLAADSIIVSLTEGWRGKCCHVAMTNAEGKFAHYKVCDPSFHNWIGLAMALRNQEISDFPLNNKSFNLSYCGHDL
jgi:Ni,Fe-hydrogenase III large subunit